MTEEADLCIICYSELDCSGSITYSLPECGHTFHQNCIMHWFRQANSKCPLCNNTGPFNGHPNDQRSRWNYPFERYKVLRRLSKKKDAPKDLVKGINLIKKKKTSAKYHYFPDPCNKLKLNFQEFPPSIRYSEEEIKEKLRQENCPKYPLTT